MNDPVNHPKHYTNHASGAECITITEHFCFNLGNVIKYLWRAEEKGAPLVDLKKARWYLTGKLPSGRHMDKIDLLSLHLAREGKPESRAMEARHYQDPSRNIKLRGDYMQGTKEIESLLRHELDNWIRWAMGQQYLPPSFKCPLGFLFKSTDVHQENIVRGPRVNDIEAVRFERIVVGLPERHRMAFVMYQLERAAVEGKVFVRITRGDAARLLGVQVRQYHYMVNQAHSMILREWKKAQRPVAEMD